MAKSLRIFSSFMTVSPGHFISSNRCLNRLIFSSFQSKTVSLWEKNDNLYVRKMCQMYKNYCNIKGCSKQFIDKNRQNVLNKWSEKTS